MAKSSKSNKFKSAVLDTPDISNCYQPGLKALGKYSTQIQLSASCNGSVDIDECVKPKYPNSNRWDYTFGYKSEAYFVEFHSAYTSEVTTMLNKLSWLKTWLHQNAPHLNKIKAKNGPFIWLASGKYDIPKSSPQYKKISQAGLIPKSRLIL